MGSDTRPSIHKLYKECNIHFDRTDPTRWPQHLAKTFFNIRKLGRTEFDVYCQNITIESDQKPWRAGTKTRAQRIADLATRTLNESKREIGWRLNLEHEVLARFTVEVSCPDCRARLWRSEQEADVCSVEPGEFAQTLEARRRKRTPCMCVGNRKWSGPFEQGLNPIFGDRSDELIDYEKSLADALKKGKCPERIYGLRETKNLKKLLSETKDESGTYLEDLVRYTPFKDAGPDPLLFPFLVLEAKSEKGPDAFSSIEAQTVFAIRALLQLQNELRNAAQEHRRWDNEPLVWFLANKGEQWRVAAAYAKEIGESQHYHICDLWSGRICDRDAALQLVLILDYIFDWARDVYRNTIISQLRSLAAVNAPSLNNDSDILSTLGPVNAWMAGFDKQCAPELNEDDPDASEQQTTPSGVPAIFKEFDCRSGVFRDARFFHTRFHGIHLTPDTLAEFLRSESTIAKSQKLARIILAFLKDAIRINAATLWALERLWTNNESPVTDSPGRSAIHLVKVYFAAYLSSSWDQNFDLVYFALEESAVENLEKYANPNNRWNLTIRWHIYPNELPLISHEDFLRSPQQLRHHSSRRDMLLAAINKRSLTMNRENVSVEQSSIDSDGDVIHYMCSMPEVTISTDLNAQGIRYVLSYYNRFKIGMNQPSQSFLRHASCEDEQDSRVQKTQFWHKCLGEDPDDVIPNDENVLGLSSRPGNVCLYFIDGLEHSMPKWDQWWNLDKEKSASQFFESKLENLVVEADAKCSQVKAQAPKVLSKERSPSKLDPPRQSVTPTFLQQLGAPKEWTSVRDPEDPPGHLDDARLEHVPKVSTEREASKALETEDETQASETNAFPDTADQTVSLRDAESPWRLRLSVCKLIQEFDCLTRMRRAARASEQGMAALPPRSPRSVSDTGKRPIELTGNEDGHPADAQGPAKRLSIRDPPSVIEGDRLSDQELEALDRDGFVEVSAWPGVKKEARGIEVDGQAMS